MKTLMRQIRMYST